MLKKCLQTWSDSFLTKIWRNIRISRMNWNKKWIEAPVLEMTNMNWNTMMDILSVIYIPYDRPYMDLRLLNWIKGFIEKPGIYSVSPPCVFFWPPVTNSMLLYSTLLCKKLARLSGGHKKLMITKRGGGGGARSETWMAIWSLTFQLSLFISFEKWNFLL